MIVSQYFVLFIIFSFLGWVWESIYCTIKEKHFSNRGFLFGPLCPIYGSSVAVGVFLFTRVSFLAAGQMPFWKLFLICAAGSAVAEFGTSYYLEKRFHARWWDYSKMPLNVNGRICLPVTVCFGLAGVVLVRWMIPLLSNVQTSIHPLVYEASALVLMGVFGADFGLTEASLSTLLQKIEAAEKEFTDRAEAAYELVSSTPEQIEARISGFEDELHDRAYMLAENLSLRQKYIVGSVRRFHSFNPGRHEFRTGEHVREALQDIRNKKAG